MRTSFIFAILLWAGITGPTTPLSAASPAAGWGIGRFVPALEGIGQGVAANFVYDEARKAWVWTEPHTRTGTITVTPSLEVDSSDRESVHWYGNQEVGGANGSALDEDREFSRYDITIQQVTWDPEAEEFVPGHQHTYSDGSFSTAWGAYMTAQADGNGGWASGGWHLVEGSTERSEVTHAIESKATVGDFTLAAIGDPGYKATVHYQRSNMIYQGGGNWIYRRDPTPHNQQRHLSAITDDRKVVDLLDMNTKLNHATVRGSSRLRWIMKTVPVTVILKRQTYTFDQDNLSIPGPVEEIEQSTNAPVWDIEHTVKD